MRAYFPARVRHEKEAPMRNDSPLVSMKMAIHLTSLSRATIYRRIAERKFPPLVDLGGRRIAFHRDELDRWIANPRGYQQPV
jgi:predicted DNA-binding transcriptional regulator AlpA